MPQDQTDGDGQVTKFVSPEFVIKVLDKIGLPALMTAACMTILYQFGTQFLDSHVKQIDAITRTQERICNDMRCLSEGQTKTCLVLDQIATTIREKK